VPRITVAVALAMRIDSVVCHAMSVVVRGACTSFAMPYVTSPAAKRLFSFTFPAMREMS